MSQPPVPAKTWYSWGARQFSATESASVETELGWPSGTVAALQEGFRSGLGRAVGWESDSEAVLSAARVFRRGVAARRPNDATKTQDLHGHYEVEIVQTQPELGAKDTFYIVDGRLAKLWPSLTFGPRQLILTLDEHTKNLASVARILASPHAREARHWIIVGGGLLTDVAAFAAALAQVSVDFVPTTLLAMADACVGGKTGVNFAPFGKNQIGMFYFPSHVTVWPGWLATLPRRELLGGAAECIKHAFLRGDLSLAQSLAGAVNGDNLSLLATLLTQVISLKVDVVTADPAEKGMRAILNFGHTLAHALEGVAQTNLSGDQALSHGEAVGVGMVFALILSHKHAGLTGEHYRHMLDTLLASGCVLSPNDLKLRLGVTNLRSPDLRQQIKLLMAHDKKNQSHQLVEWILFKSPGQIASSVDGTWTVSLPTTVLDEQWEALLATLPSKS